MSYTDSLLSANTLPEFTISASMRSAAASVAACFHAYQYSCQDLPNARHAGKIPENLQAQRERKQAYHLALKFLRTATYKENPDYNVAKHPQPDAHKQQELQELLAHYLDQKLNQLIGKEAQKTGVLGQQNAAHPVANGPW